MHVDNSAMQDEEKIGAIFISPLAIASVASQALMTSYGVVGMARRTPLGELAAAMTRDPNHGITVVYLNEQLTIDIYIIVQFGTNISSIAESVVEAVRFNVEKYVGIPVYRVKVYVQGIRELDS